MNRLKARSIQIPKTNGFALIILTIILALVIGIYLVWMQFFQPSRFLKTNQNSLGQASETPTPTTSTNQSTPTPTPIVFPEVNVSNWKTYTEAGGRRNRLLGVEGDDAYKIIDDYKKYTFKYPPNWAIEVSDSYYNQHIFVKKPDSNYYVEIFYNSSKDYSEPVLYELENGVLIEAFEEYGNSTAEYYSVNNDSDGYDVILDPPHNSPIWVNVYIVDEQGNFYDTSDIATARAILKSFGVVE